MKRVNTYHEVPLPQGSLVAPLSELRHLVSTKEERENSCQHQEGWPKEHYLFAKNGWENPRTVDVQLRYMLPVHRWARYEGRVDPEDSQGVFEKPAWLIQSNLS